MLTVTLTICLSVEVLRSLPKKFFLSKAKGKPRLNTANMQDPVLVSQFTDLFEKEYAPESDELVSADKCWQSLKAAMHKCDLATFGR